VILRNKLHHLDFQLGRDTPNPIEYWLHHLARAMACSLGKVRLHARHAVSPYRGYRLWATPRVVTRLFIIAGIIIWAPINHFRALHGEVSLGLRQIIRRVCAEMGVTIGGPDYGGHLAAAIPLTLRG
jgi:hypothetical protein